MDNTDEVILALETDETQGSTTRWITMVSQNQLTPGPRKYDHLNDGPRIAHYD